MTLSAAFRINNVPLNLSDVLITSNGSRQQTKLLPTQSDVADLIPENWKFHISDLRRKTYIINEKFVVSASGYLSSIEEVLVAFKNEFPKKTPTYIELQSLLSRFVDFDEFEVSLAINLINDDTSDTYMWSSNNPTFLVAEPLVVIGSGSKDFRNTLEGATVNIPPGLNPYQSTKELSMQLCSSLFAKEYITGENFNRFYGGAFESAFYNGISFEFTDNYSLILWHAEKVNDSITFKYSSDIYRFFYWQNIFCVKKYTKVLLETKDNNDANFNISPSPHYTLIPSLIETNYSINESIKSLINAHNDPSYLAMPSNYIHMVVVYDETEQTKGLGPIFVPILERTSGDPNFLLKEKYGQLDISVKKNLFTHFEQTIIDNFY